MGIHEQAQFSQRLRTREVPEWCEFLRLWAAFNCIYSEDKMRVESDRIVQTIRTHMKDSAARAIIDRSGTVISRILQTPPGDMRKDATDANFREKTQRFSAAYGDLGQPSTERLSALMGVIYQVRCNLLHGDKDPDDARDMDLVRDSIIILRELLPALEESIGSPA